jgi:hypothetical protein
MLSFLDYLLSFLHLAIVAFNLFGWIPPVTRKAHLVSLFITAVSWFILGIWFGIGYCPVTDWQWQVKTQLGERNLPASFVTYYADKLTGRHINPSLITNITAISFALAVLASLYVNIRGWRRLRKRGMKEDEMKR